MVFFTRSGNFLATEQQRSAALLLYTVVVAVAVAGARARPSDRSARVDRRRRGQLALGTWPRPSVPARQWHYTIISCASQSGRMGTSGQACPGYLLSVNPQPGSTTSERANASAVTPVAARQRARRRDPPADLELVGYAVYEREGRKILRGVQYPCGSARAAEAVAAKPVFSTPVHHFHFAVFRSKWIPWAIEALPRAKTGTWYAHCNLTPMRRKCKPKRARARANGNARTTPQLPHMTWYVQCLAARAHICPRISFPLRLHGRRGACMGEAGCCHAARLRAYTPGSSDDLGCIHYLLSRSHAGERATRQAMTMKGSNLGQRTG